MVRLKSITAEFTVNCMPHLLVVYSSIAYVGHAL
jgi:hypothetical protein